MTTSQKAIISLLIAVILVGGFSFLAFTGLFNVIENRFYNPSVTTHLNRDISQNAEAIDKFFAETRERFSETLKTDAVRHAFLSSQNAEDVSARSRIYSQLRESFYGVQWVRFISAEGDAGGHKLLFSSYSPDVLNSDGSSPVYKDYNEPDLPYEIIAVPEDGTPKYTFDKAGRVIFSFPLYDSFDIYWGTALFSLSIDALSARLASEGRIKPGEDITVISNPAGLLFGMPASSEAAVLSQVSSSWVSLLLSSRFWRPVEKTAFAQTSVPGFDHTLVLLSTSSSHGFFVGRLVNEEVFLLPTILKIILLLAFFLTTYLIIYLLFNLRQDPLIVVQNRLKQLQISLIEQFYERKSEADWARWIRELEHRREEVRALLKRGVKADSRTRCYRDNIADKNADMDILINKSWEELLAMLGSRRNLAIPGETGFDEEKIISVLQKLLEAARTGAPSPVEKMELVEELEVLKELDEAEIAMSIDLSIEDEEPFSESKTHPSVSQTDVDILANQIEFNSDIEPEAADDEFSGTKFRDELEIVSPFSTMVFDSSPTDDAGAEEEGPSKRSRDKNADDEQDTNATEGLPLITTPFSGFSSGARIEILEVFNDEKESQTNGDAIIREDDSVIKEREGIHYISEDVLTPSPEFAATLNPGFKELVDEVTK